MCFRIHPVDLKTSGQETFERASCNYFEELLIREMHFRKKA